MCRKISRKTLAKILNQIQQKLCATLSAVTTTSGCGGLALASSIRRTPPGCLACLNAYVLRTWKVYPSLPSRWPPLDRRPFPWNCTWRHFLVFFRFLRFFFRIRKFAQKTESPKTLFFRPFCASLASRRRLSAVFSPEKWPRSMDFQAFLQNRGFPEIASTLRK